MLQEFKTINSEHNMQIIFSDYDLLHGVVVQLTYENESNWVKLACDELPQKDKNLIEKETPI